MTTNYKILAFEYLLTLLLRWYHEVSQDKNTSSFTRLKALKLLFFTTAVKNNDGKDLLDIFDNYYAMQNGPVESDIYNAITRDQLTYYSFVNFSLEIKKEFDDNILDNSIRERIASSVNALRKENKFIVNYDAGKLVDLSHMWLSWQNSIQIAMVFGKGSYPMSVDMIRKNTQIFEIWDSSK